MLTWVAVGVAAWLLLNAAFVVGMVRCRDRARRADARVRPSEESADGPRAVRGDDPPPTWAVGREAGRPTGALGAGGRTW